LLHADAQATVLYASPLHLGESDNNHVEQKYPTAAMSQMAYGSSTAFGAHHLL
jgi:hypothetical protein